MTTPCAECPFLKKFRRGFTLQRLHEHASGEFACHKTCEVDESEDGTGTFEPGEKSVHCAGALIFHEKRGTSHNMMRICERLGFYDYTKLDMEAPVR